MIVENFTVTIRTEDAKDYPSVYDVNTNAFGRKEEARLVDRLRLSNNFIPELSIVASVDDKVVGHILFTEIFIKNGAKEIPTLALAPMAVTPQYQRKGIGQRLVRYGFEEAQKLGFKSVFVLGSSDYYTKFGFTPTTKWQIVPPLNFPKEAFMGIELEEGSLSEVKGDVKYPYEFDLF